MAGRLENKVCVITGSGGSMGREAALAFAREGAAVVGCDVNIERGRAVCDEVLAAGGRMISMEPCDLTSAADCAQLVSLALDTYGKIDVLYNNAAMAYFGWIETLPAADWNRTIDQELNLVFQLTQAAWPSLAKAGGSIINVASISAWQAQPGFPAAAHCAAKGGVLALTRQLAMEGAPKSIRANSISPGIIASYQTAPFLDDPAFIENVRRAVMLGRPGTALEVANVALFLASDDASYVTGTDIKVDGGAMAW